MDENIKKLISETFNELYEELIGEAPVATTENGMIRDSEIEPIIEKAARTGRGFSFNQTVNNQSQENFNIIVDNLLSRYKQNPAQNFKCKEAVQNAFVPTPKGKLSWILGKVVKNKTTRDEDIADAISEAYTIVMVRDFDKGLEAYQMNGGFGAQVISQMKLKVLEFIYPYEKKLGGDAYDIQNGTVSLDAPAGDNRTIGDTFAAQEFTSNEGETSTGKEILNSIMIWLENHVGSSEFPVNEKQFIAFKGVISGDSPEQIFEENPGVFSKPKDVNIYFDRFTTSKPAQEISDLISTIYDIDFNLSNLNKFGLKQTSSQNPEWNSFSKVDERFTEEMKAIQGELFNSLKSLGYEPTDFNSDKKIKSIIDDLSNKGMNSEASVVESLFDDLEEAKLIAKSKGLYGANTTYLPQSEKEEETTKDEFGGFFEGVNKADVEKLMERVFNRLSK